MSGTKLIPPLVLLLIAASAPAGTLSSYTYVEATITTPSGPLPYSAQFASNPGFLGSDPDSLLASDTLFGTWFDQGVDWQGELGSYSVDLLAKARAEYGDLGVYARNYTDAGSWLGPVIDANTRAYAEASFDDIFRLAEPGADGVWFTFDLQGTGPVAPAFMVNGSPEGLSVWVPAEPDGTVHLNALLSLDVSCTGPPILNSNCGVEADYFNSMRLIGAEVLCSSCETPPDPRLFTLNRYSGISTIAWVPEPATAWLVAIPIVLFAIRRGVAHKRA